MMLQQIQYQIKEFFREEHIVFTDEKLQALHQRNEDRAKAAIEALGEKWIGHPNRAIQRIEQ
jgi:hypothetical protein